MHVCPKCDHHFSVSASERIAQLLDDDTFEEWYAAMRPGDPLEFNDRRPYPVRVKDEHEFLDSAEVPWRPAAGKPLWAAMSPTPTTARPGPRAFARSVGQHSRGYSCAPIHG